MTTGQKVSIYVAVITAVSGIVVAVVQRLPSPDPQPAPQPAAQTIVMHGMVMVDDANPARRIAIPGVRVESSNGLASQFATTGSDGMFTLQLVPGAKDGVEIDLSLTHTDYQERDSALVVGDNVPYTFYLWPAAYPAAYRMDPRPRTFGFLAVAATPRVLSKTFQITNHGSVRCNGRQPCSPDGKWKANIGSASLEAGPGRVFTSGHADCIAGPCPWTSIESNGFSGTGRNSISVAVRNWSDTVTYKLWGEVGPAPAQR